MIQTEKSGTLGVSQDQTLITKCLNSWGIQSKHIAPENGVAESLYSGECRYGGGESYVMTSRAYCVGNGQAAQTTVPPVAHALDCMHDQQAVMVREEPLVLESNQNHAVVRQDGKSPTLSASMGMGGGYVPMMVQGVDCYNSTVPPVAMTVRAKNADNEHIPCVTYGLDRASFNQGQNAKYDFAVEEEKAQPLVARGPGGGY